MLIIKFLSLNIYIMISENVMKKKIYVHNVYNTCSNERNTNFELYI